MANPRLPSSREVAIISLRREPLFPPGEMRGGTILCVLLERTGAVIMVVTVWVDVYTGDT